MRTAARAVCARGNGRGACGSAEAFAGMGQPLAGIVMEYGGGEARRHGGCCWRSWAVRADSWRKARSSSRWAEPMQQRGHARLGAADGQAGEALAGLEKLIACGAGQAVGLVGQCSAILCWASVINSAAAEGVGARRSATKSAMVKSVSWPTAETMGSARGGDGAGNALAVEGGQIFQRSSAAGEDDDVNEV